MKAGIFFTGTGPILILTTFNSLLNIALIKRLTMKGIKKFIAFEVPEDKVRKIYGAHFDIVMNDIKQEDDCRVLDYNGHHIFNEFSLEELGDAIIYEPKKDE